MERKIYTALGHESTAQHPAYCHSGYRYEDGRCYDIEIRDESEGKGQRRKSIYVREHKANETAVAPVPCSPREDAPECEFGSTESNPLTESTTETVEYDLEALEQRLCAGVQNSE